MNVGLVGKNWRILVIKEVEICVIENGYLVEYKRINQMTGEEEEVEIYFQEKDSAFVLAKELLGSEPQG
jgi:hypothetical protein